MKVLIVMPSARMRGGAEEALLQFCKYRVEAGVIALVVVFLEDGELCQEAEQLGCTVSVIQAGRLRQAWSFVRAIRLLADTVRRHAPNVILSWMTKAHIYSGLVGKLERVPAVYFQMGLPDGGMVDRLARFVPARGAIGCSAFVQSEQQRVVRHRVVAVPLAADLERFNPRLGCSREEAKVSLGFDPSRPLVGIVGRLQAWKGMHVFLEAMASVCAVVLEVDGVVVGGIHELEPNYPDFLAGKLRQLKLCERVRLAGQQRNIPDWMQAMDVVVHASDREPFGIVVVEAMALGKPVVATIPGGPTEIIHDGVDGILVPFGDSKALATAILRFVREPQLALACGAAAGVRARDFSPQAFSRHLGLALSDLISPFERSVPANS